MAVAHQREEEFNYYQHVRALFILTVSFLSTVAAATP
jgi:hypothetical protein